MSSFDSSAMLPCKNTPPVYSIPIRKNYVNIPRFHAFKGDTTSTLSDITSAKLDRNKTALIVTATISNSVKGAAIFVEEEAVSAMHSGKCSSQSPSCSRFIKEQMRALDRNS